MKYIWAVMLFVVSAQAFGSLPSAEDSDNKILTQKIIDYTSLSNSESKDVRGRIYPFLDNQTYKSFSLTCKVIRSELCNQDPPLRFVFRPIGNENIPDALLPISSLDLSGNTIEWCKEHLDEILKKLPRVQKIVIKVDIFYADKIAFLLDMVPIEGVPFSEMVKEIVSFIPKSDLMTLGAMEAYLSNKSLDEKLYLLYLLGYIYPKTIIQYNPNSLLGILDEMPKDKHKNFCEQKKESLNQLWTGRMALAIIRSAKIKL